MLDPVSRRVRVDKVSLEQNGYFLEIYRCLHRRKIECLKQRLITQKNAPLIVQAALGRVQGFDGVRRVECSLDGL